MNLMILLFSKFIKNNNLKNFITLFSLLLILLNCSLIKARPNLIKIDDSSTSFFNREYRGDFRPLQVCF